MADLFIDTSARLRMSYDSCRLQRYPVAELGLRPRSTEVFKLREHVTHVRCRFCSEFPSWDHVIPDEWE